MLWQHAAMVIIVFLRAGEMTIPSDKGFNPAVHLTRMDIAVDNQVAPCTLRVQLKQSKTDQFGQGIFLFVGILNGRQ